MIKKRALIIRGLRQVGKTTVVLDYCKKNYQNVIYLNFMERKSLNKIFDQDLIVNNIIRDLSAQMPGVKFIPNKIVIIFDELQECANARSSIKPFMLDGRFDIIATGSLLGLRGYNRKENKGIPTGLKKDTLIRILNSLINKGLIIKKGNGTNISYCKKSK